MIEDLSALAWVHDELRRSLETAHKALRRFLKEAELAGTSDVDAVDPAILRQARTQIHQGAGALELVGLSGGAQILRAAESALIRLASKPRLINGAAVDTIERGSFALLDYLSRRLGGKPVQALALFPQYRALQELAGATRVHPADLWSHEWHWQPLASEAVPALQPEPATVARVERQMLVLMRGSDAAAADRMSALFASLAAGAQGRLATLWQLAAGFFEAQAHGLLAADVYSKRMASRLLAQLRAGGAAEPSDRLAHDLLFFCAQAKSAEQTRPGSRLEAIRRAWQLTAQSRIDYEGAQLGRFDPAWLAQARKRVVGAKEVWSAVAGGELERLPGLTEQFALVGDSVQRLYTQGVSLAQALQAAASHTVATAAAPSPGLAMEVATAMLYVEASLTDGDFDHPEMAERVRHLASRIDLVRQGQDAGPLDLWMEELYRRVSDHQTMGSVVQELRASLSEIEKQVDHYFRNPAQREVLIPVPAQLSSMRGVLSVLGMDQASHAVLRMRDDVDALANTEVDPQRAIQAGTFNRLAENVGALSFLIDMVSVQPQMAKSLFTFDSATGSLKAVMGRAWRPSGFGELDDAPAPPVFEPTKAMAQNIAEASSQADPGSLARDLDQLVLQARASDQLELADAASLARDGLSQAKNQVQMDAARVQVAAQMAEFGAARPPQFLPESAPPRPVPAPGPPVAAGSTGLEEDDEMRDVFLEEAAEVLTTARTSLEALRGRPDDLAELTTVRRAFHTLKGSARMVGLKEFGEAAWSCEQLFNSRLADNLPADTDLREFSLEALDLFAGWVQAITGRRAETFHSSVLAAAAESLRVHGIRMPVGGVDAAVPGFAQVSPAQVQHDWSEPADHRALVEPMVEPLPELVLDFDDPAEGVEPALPAQASTLQAMVPDLPSAADLDLDFAHELNDPVSVQAPPAESAQSEVTFDLELPGLDDPQELVPVPALEMGTAPLSSSSATDVPDRVINLAPLESLPDWVAPEAVSFELDLGALDDAVPVRSPDPVVALPLIADEPNLLPVPAALDPARQSNAIEPSLQDDSNPVLALLALPGLTSFDDESAPQLETGGAASSGLVPEPEVVAAAAEGFDDAEQYKMIGPLRIGITLFNIYLNEADELSRRLVTELAEWAHELYRPVSDNAVALAHSLAGSSATVGFLDLSQLARTLEHALLRSQSRGGGHAGEASLFGESAVEVRRLLHQFAAGFVTSPPPDLLRRLAEHEPALPLAEMPQRVEPAQADVHDAVQPWMAAAAEPDLVLDSPQAMVATAQPLAKGLLTTPVVASSATGFSELRQFEIKTLAALSEVEQRTVIARRDALDAEDDIDAVDAIDAELFPIFEEEALELLPQLQSRMRDWSRRPSEAAAASACMRTLHTLKGGARLAGAMRLGEMAHRLETAIEHLLAAGHPTADDVERLVSRVDAIEANLDVLRSGESADGAMAVLGLEHEKVAPEAALEVVETVPAGPLDAVPAAEGLVQMPAADGLVAAIDWSAFAVADASAIPASALLGPVSQSGGAAVRVRAPLLDRLVNHAGEVSITRARIEADVGQLKSAVGDLTENLERLRRQLRDIELQAESQIESRLEAAKSASSQFDPLEMDRFTRFQELTRMMAESVNDVATVQRGLQRTLQSTEDELAAQARLTRDLQDDLLRTRMVEFEGLSERLYRVVRQAAKETGKQVRLDIVGGSIEIDRGVLDRMTGSFEHLLRNSVAHGVELPAIRSAAGKDATGTITILVTQEGNEVGVEFRDDGAGLDLARIREKARAQGRLAADSQPSDAELAALIFAPGFTTAETVTGLAGRGVGMDVVRSDVNAMGGRIETATTAGQGASFRLVLPLTTAVTQVVMLRCGDLTVAVPSTLVEIVRRSTAAEVTQAYATGSYRMGDRSMPFFWLGSLLQASALGVVTGRTVPVVVIRSAAQHVVIHVDEVIGNQEVVVKNLGPQLSRLPGLAGMTLLPSGQPALIYNPVALATLHGESARAASLAAQAGTSGPQLSPEQAVDLPALVLVVDDSLTVRRVTQRLLSREGYRVSVAKDGLEGLERLSEERPAVLLTDIEMPRMDGFDLVRNMRVDPKLADLPVIMITSRIAQKHRDYAAELGVDHYLGKPYSEEDLLALVARYARAAQMA